MSKNRCKLNNSLAPFVNFSDLAPGQSRAAASGRHRQMACDRYGTERLTEPTEVLATCVLKWLRTRRDKTYVSLMPCERNCCGVRGAKYMFKIELCPLIATVDKAYTQRFWDA